MRQVKVGQGLLRALREGGDALPEDLEELHGYLKLIGDLLSEKAIEHEPSWSLALAAAAELQTLQGLEAMVARKAAQVQARALGQVLTKLAIWQALESSDDGEETSLRDSLVHSVRLDLQRLARAR